MLPTTDNLLLGRQLRCPEGELAKEIGDYIFSSNRNMIMRTIDSLSLSKTHQLLEIGFGNAAHLPYLLDRAPQLCYTGVERSMAMYQEATTLYKELIAQKKAVFLLAPDGNLPTLPPQRFELCLMVNIHYFISNLQAYFQQLYELLSPKAQLVMGYIDLEFGKRMPFTKEVFTFYTNEELQALLLSAGFKDFEFHPFTEEILTKHNTDITRSFWVMKARK